jgi:GTP-binding protein HflX
VIPISALRQRGLEALGEALAAAAEPDLVAMELLVPYGNERILADLHREGVVEETEYTDRGTYARGRAPRQALYRFQEFVVG